MSVFTDGLKLCKMNNFCVLCCSFNRFWNNECPTSNGSSSTYYIRRRRGSRKAKLSAGIIIMIMIYVGIIHESVNRRHSLARTALIATVISLRPTAAPEKRRLNAAAHRLLSLSAVSVCRGYIGKTGFPFLHSDIVGRVIDIAVSSACRYIIYLYNYLYL